MQVEQFNARERWIVAGLLLVILLLLGGLRSSGQALSSFNETNALRRVDKVPVISAASGSNVNLWITQSNLWSQMATSLLGSGSITVSVSQANGTVTFSGSVDASMSNALVSLINTASNANNTKITVTSNALQTWVTLNSNNIASGSNAFRLADTAISNQLATLTNNSVGKLDATNGTSVGLTLTGTMTNTGTMVGAGPSVFTNFTTVAGTNVEGRSLKIVGTRTATDSAYTNELWRTLTFLRAAGGSAGFQVLQAGGAQTNLAVDNGGNVTIAGSLTPTTNAAVSSVLGTIYATNLNSVTQLMAISASGRHRPLLATDASIQYSSTETLVVGAATTYYTLTNYDVSFTSGPNAGINLTGGIITNLLPNATVNYTFGTSLAGYNGTGYLEEALFTNGVKVAGAEFDRRSTSTDIDGSQFSGMLTNVAAGTTLEVRIQHTDTTGTVTIYSGALVVHIQ